MREFGAPTELPPSRVLNRTLPPSSGKNGRTSIDPILSDETAVASLAVHGFVQLNGVFT